MDDRNPIYVPFASFEGVVSSYERTNLRLFILCIILVTALVGSNAGWLYYESQWQRTESTEISQDVDTGEGTANVIGVGDLNGED